ncbi:uncharacterized protein K452DRAFT_317048, partial [Aplosporella prunicola CBS 121167]
ACPACSVCLSTAAAAAAAAAAAPHHHHHHHHHHQALHRAHCAAQARRHAAARPSAPHQRSRYGLDTEDRRSPSRSPSCSSR